MGMVLMFAGLAGFLVTMIIGLILKRQYKIHSANNKGSSKALFYQVALAVFLVVVLLGYSYIPESHGGAPTGKDFEKMMYVFLIIGSAPGFGLIFGSLAGIFFNKNKH